MSLHSGGIHAIAINDGKLICSGYRDKMLKVYDSDSMNVEKEYKLDDYARSLDFMGGKIILGTRDG